MLSCKRVCLSASVFGCERTRLPVLVVCWGVNVFGCERVFAGCVGMSVFGGASARV